MSRPFKLEVVLGEPYGLLIGAVDAETNASIPHDDPISLECKTALECIDKFTSAYILGNESKLSHTQFVRGIEVRIDEHFTKNPLFKGVTVSDKVEV